MVRVACFAGLLGGKRTARIPASYDAVISSGLVSAGRRIERLNVPQRNSLCCFSFVSTMRLSANLRL